MKFKFLERSWMFSLLFLLMIANTVFSQSSDDSVDDIENKKLKDSKNYIGLAVGTSTASGICYRYMDNWGIQFTIIPPIINDDYEFVDGGITLLKEFFSARWIRLFIYTAVSAVYEHTYTYDYSLEEEIKYELKRLLLNWGIGPGLEFYWKHFGIDLMVGYGVYTDMLNNYKVRTGISLEAGIFFRW